MYDRFSVHPKAESVLYGDVRLQTQFVRQQVEVKVEHGTPESEATEDLPLVQGHKLEGPMLDRWIGLPPFEEYKDLPEECIEDLPVGEGDIETQVPPDVGTVGLDIAE